MSKKVYESSNAKAKSDDGQEQQVEGKVKKIISDVDYSFYLKKQAQLDTLKINYTDMWLQVETILQTIRSLETDKENFVQQLMDKYQIKSSTFSINNDTLEIMEE